MVDLTEFRKVFYSKTIVPKFDSISDYSDTRDEEEETTFPFNFTVDRVHAKADIFKTISNICRSSPNSKTLQKLMRQTQDVLEASAAKSKLKHYRELDTCQPQHDCVLAHPQSYYFEKIRHLAENLPMVGLLPEWEENIRNMIVSNLRLKYIHIVEEQMEEVKVRYREEIHSMSVRRVVAIECQEICNIDDISIPPFKFDGRTKNYSKFLRNRCALMKKYYFPHKLMKNIVLLAYTVMPEVIVDFSQYRELGYIDLHRFLDLVEADMKKGGLMVTGIYYGEIARLLSQPRYIHDVPSTIVNSFINCATNLLASQIMIRMMATIEHIILVMSDWSTVPLLKVDLKCEANGLFIYPLITEIYSSFHGIVDDIKNLAQLLPPLESWVGIRTDAEVINTKIPQWYMEEAHQKLQETLEKTYQPLNDYVAELHQTMGVVYNPETHRDIIRYVAQGHTFDECIDRVEEFYDYIQQINGMTEHEYFSVGKLHQADAKNGLLFYTNQVRDLIIGELVKRHQNYNLEICAAFEEIRDRVLTVPQTTRELLSLGEYITEASSTKMAELREKITLSLNMLASLIEMTTLDKDHIELNNITVNWLKKIRPIFEQSSSMYEQLKFDMEENLQNKVASLSTQVEEMFPKLVIMDDMDDVNRIREYIEDMRKLVRGLDRMDEQAEWINSEEALFNYPLTPYPRIKELKENILPYYSLIYRGYQWQRHRDVWLDGPFEYLDAIDIEGKTNDYFADFTKTSKQYKTKIKMQIAVEYPYTFAGSPDDPDPFQQPAPLKLCYQLLEDIKWFKQYIPLLTTFRNPALRQIHWDDMSVIAGFDLTPDAGTTLRKMINMDLMEDIEKYELISVSATKELALEQLLEKLIHDWDDIIFTTTPYKESGVEILTHLDDIQTLLEEQIVKMQAMRGSAFVKLIEKEVKDFYELLLRMQSTIEEWSKVQVQWMYLLPIFSSKDIVAQLPEEEVLFREVDTIFRRAMYGVSKEPHVRETAGAVGMLETMKEANTLMETVNNGVLNYLEKKRLFFPRFFFLSNDDMLEILSETKEPLRVQPHLKKCFEGINRLGFNEEMEIYSMISDDYEEIEMREQISTAAARGCVEKWLIQVEEQMINSVRHEILMSYLDYEVNDRVVWVIIWPGMVVLCVSQIYWSIEVQNCLMTHMLSTMEALYDKLKRQILNMVNLVKGQLSKQNRTTLNALITLDVHAMDVVKLLIDKRIMDETDFEWLSQLRYYWEDDVFVRIIHATIPYAYEYIGNCPRLVITPLTDRCYRTLIGAYSLHLNGAPEGPAGTGKTETTKDLSRALAVQCVVFNCSEGLDYKNMGKFFKGLASCGAWSCFDEFNRIELEVLSVVAQQILCIIQAVRAKVETFVFEGTELKLNPAVYICITMNPGYAGRSELPDNLKVLFRTVAMMVPDYAMIAEIFLYSSGFSTARALSTKIVTTYKLCSEQLSTQSHYDYGMRAVKTVLTAAQNIKLKYPDEDESILLLRSIIDVNLPKFLAHDIPLFQGIVSDLFPGLTLPSPSYKVLLKAVHEVTRKKNLQPVDSFLLKIIQTFEMMIVRHGFMLVGEPFGGKTSILHTLADALTLMDSWDDENGATTKFFTLNPKAITLGQLYGCFDPVSSEWTDGVCAVAFRSFCMEDTPSRKWLIFDGPVDAVWIENLNTVLDDNKKLCLTSGEIMQMTGVMSMIFEAMDLLHASPATVSRCGMIYVEPRVLGWRPFVKSWINTLDEWKEGYEENIHQLFEWLMDPCLEFIRKKCRMTITAGQIHQVISTMTLFEMFIIDAIEDNAKAYDQYIVFWVQAAMLLAIIWGAGGTLDYDSRCKFNEYYLSFWRNEVEDRPIPEFIGDNLIAIPKDELIHDYYYTFRGKGAWRKLVDVARQEKFEETQSIVQTMIPTIDTVKYQTLFEKHIRHRKRFLLYGETGTGKSFYIKDLMMNKLDESLYLPNFITFTPKTTAWLTQELVILKLYKRKRNHFGPQVGTHCIVFIDEVNMPAKEIYGAQPPIELLRQLFDHGNWYDLRKPEKILVFDTMFICAMAPAGGSRQDVYQRFLRHFNLYTITTFSEDSVFRIFSNIAMIGLSRNGFTGAVVPVLNDIVNATMEIFQSASKELRPTPKKSHYLFNLRDLSRVITGCTMVKKESFESRSDFTKLWVHEVLRVFGDRLIDDADRRWLFQQIKETVQQSMKESFDTLFDHLPKFDDQLTDESLQSLIFGNFMDVDALPGDRRYEEVLSMDEYREVAITCLDEYNNTHRNKIDIVLFRYALEHLARISRILAIPCGSLLMVGVGGSGRQSLTRLASGMAGIGLFQPEIGSAYDLHEWREDIKKVLKQSGGTGKDFVFLFGEGQLKDEAFLEDIDSLLNMGEVPNLFTVEERQEIIEMTRLAAQGGNRNLDVSVLTVLSFFVNRCKEKLHIMLWFSPIGDTFRIRLRMYPSLVNCCTIDWFEVWPEDALEQVALRFTTSINVDDDVKVNAVTACKYFHVCAKDVSDRFYRQCGRKSYVTTAAFLDLIRTFAQLMEEKQDELTLARDRYLGGLDKLQYAAEQIGKMRITLSELRPQLEASAHETAETMKQIETENTSVKNATILVKRDEDAANVQAEVARQLTEECEADLAEALPALEEALAALNTLKPSDIAVVKTMKRPPEGVKLVLAAVCVMLSIPPIKVEDPNTGAKSWDYWTPSKRLLGDMKFLDNLRQYDKDNIPVPVMQEIERRYMTDKNFEPKVVAKASQAAEGLCKWIRAMVLYDKVAKVVAPKKAKLAAAQQDYQQTMAFLKERRRMLVELESKLAILRENLEKTLAKKIELENAVTLCRNKLIRAEKLINGLGGEKDRWMDAAKNLQKLYDCLPGDILVSCGVIAYLGPYTAVYRAENIDKWKVYVKNLKIPCSETYSFVEVLGSEIKVNSWNIFGLPRDSFSIENAIIMDNSKRWSLFVDPQSQANKWIRNMERNSELEVVKLTDKTYMTTIEQAIEYGKPVLIENVHEELAPPLDPILARCIYKISGIWHITLGEKVIQYDEKFRLYITTKLRNPHYLPEVFNKVTLINFALTIEGLEDQLLGIVVAKERPDLQQKREYLIVQSAANRKALKQVEDNILKTLSVSGATILEDEEAIEILDSSKLLSGDILKKQQTAKKTEAKIEVFRQSYQPIAKHSSALYYTLTDLPSIDPMYQYSLAWFINLYITSIEGANKSNILERRLMFLRETFTSNLYQNVCRSLFEKDKLLYSFVLYTTMLLAAKEVNKEEMMFLISGGVALGSVPQNPAPEWLSDKSWNEISRVETLPRFNGFVRHFTQNLKPWKDYYDLLQPQNASLPTPWQTKLRPFEQLIVMRMIRPDKMTLMVQRFVEDGMGRNFITPPPFDISKSYNDSNSLIPMIFILSPGSDPMESLMKFADSVNYISKFNSISLGQGQGPIAQRLIEQAQAEGSWVCLQNCHLAVSWMPSLEKICESLDPTNTLPTFRLWLTSYPSEEFPISVLQNGVKMTNEPPTGLQKNLMRSFEVEGSVEPDFFSTNPKKKKPFSRLLYALCFFHAVVQERRSFGPQGWNIRYGFNESDLQISAQQLQVFIDDYEEVPFKAITYLTGECNYGGRVTDDRDRRCLITILKDFYNPNVVTDPNYAFADGAEYTMPKRYDYQDYIKQIQMVPVSPTPEVFGLHMNAGITRDLEVSRDFFDSLLLIQGTVTVGDTTKQDELLLSMKNDISKRMPEMFDIEEAQKIYPVMYHESMNTVLIQEMERYNTLLAEIRQSLQTLEKAVKGLIVMTPAMEILATHILSSKIPPSWIKASAYPTLKPLPSFVDDFLERLKFLRKWSEKGKPPTFWISGFSFVHAFLTAAMQNYARKYKVPIDRIEFDYEVLTAFQMTTSPTDGVYVYGMYLCGARWDLQKMRLAESYPKILYDLMPIIWMKPVEISKLATRNRYECPLYITSARFGVLKTTGHSTNYVLSILLDTNVAVNHWIKRGLALLCQLDT